MRETESTNSESSVSTQVRRAGLSLRGWTKVGAIAAASALAGGLAAAWFYRKTLNRLREAEEEESHSGIETEYDI